MQPPPRKTRPEPPPASGSDALEPAGTQERWWQLQRLRRGQTDPEPFLAAILAGGLSADADLVAALLGVLDRQGVDRLLSHPSAVAVPLLLEVALRELPLLAGQERVRQAWLEPLLERHSQEARRDPAAADRWLELLGPFRDPEVAERLRQALRRLQPIATDPPRTAGQPSPAGPPHTEGQPIATEITTKITAEIATKNTTEIATDRAPELATEIPAEIRTESPAEMVAGGAAVARTGQARLPRGSGDHDRSAAWAGVEALAPLLGLQRCSQDGALLLEMALAPGPTTQRRAALEGLALGLSAWPRARLATGLMRLSGDLDPQLAAGAVDLMARLPDGRRSLRRVARRSLDACVRERLRRRLPATPLVLLVHGRQGGQIPPELWALATELQHLRGSPVLLQALTRGEAPQPDAGFWAAAHRAGGLSLVPLLLLPGGHVRRDLPQLAQAWRERAEGAGGLALWRSPFLGSWPAWQTQLRGQLTALAAGRRLLWLHHPLDGRVGTRYVAHLSRVLGHPGVAAPLGEGWAWPTSPPGAALLVPWSLAANRLSEALAATDPRPGQELLPPLLQVPSLRQTLLELLGALA